jgi:hypothetical protein
VRERVISRDTPYREIYGGRRYIWYRGVKTDSNRLFDEILMKGERKRERKREKKRETESDRKKWEESILLHVFQC